MWFLGVVYTPSHLDIFGVCFPVHCEHVWEPSQINQGVSGGVVKRVVDASAAGLPAIVDAHVVVA